MSSPAVDTAFARAHSAKRKLVRLLEQLGRDLDEPEQKRYMDAVAPVEAQVQRLIELLKPPDFIERRPPAKKKL